MNTENDNWHTLLSSLVMNDGELSALEARLKKFNLFRTLRADKNELRHSNVLAWLLDPQESHGFKDMFLRRWLMEIMNTASLLGSTSPSISPVLVDAAEFLSVKVEREWKNLDVMLTCEVKVSGKTEKWALAVENKVNSKQGKNQLIGYRQTLQSSFPKYDRLFFVFLTKNNEQPKDTQWLQATYSDVEQALRLCVAENEDTIGSEPIFLINQYLELIREDFMDDSESVQLARAIYQRHKKAIDYIFECKIDPIFELTSSLEQKLSENAESLEIILSRSGKGRLRFIPRNWATAKNAKGRAWGDDGHFVVIELDLYPKTVEVSILSGDAPDNWTDTVWEHCARKPFQRSQKTKPRRFLKAYREKSQIKVSGIADLDVDAASEKIFNWFNDLYTTEEFTEARVLMTDLLESL